MATAKKLKTYITGRAAAGKAAVKHLTTIHQLKDEIALLTSYSSDTIYRLRYDTMQYDYISPSVTRLLGYSLSELKKINLRALILQTRLVEESMHLVQSYADLEENRKRGEVRKWQADYLMRRKDGKEIWVADISYPWFDKKGAIIGSIGSMRDITERMQAEQRMREQMMNMKDADPLTGLAGRELFWNRLEEEARRVKRTHSDLSLLLLSVDQFHSINETYGQEMGDSVIAGIGQMIRSILRDIDTGARVNNEEFAVILPETTAEGAAKVAERIRDTIMRHTFFAGSQSHPVGCTVSIGIAGTSLGQSTDAAHLYKLADMRLYIAKHTGENQISVDETAGNLH